MNQYQSFRLAAVLYADNNYEVSPKTIHKKIVETILLNHTTPVSVDILVELIEQSYELRFEEKEIETIIKDKKNDGFFIKPKENSFVVCLTEERKQVIEKKINKNNIDFFISEYEKKIGKNIKDIIYRFLYEVLNSNIESFRKLTKNQLQELTDVYEDYSSFDKEIINDFLSWDNDEKNKAIFDIASYALEYCMISNNNMGLQLNSLKNKKFYLDTNVIFRALGINGNDRQLKTVTFLNKLVETKTEIFVSKFSEEEFNKTINFYIEKFSKNQIRGKINPRVFEKKFFRNSSEIYDYYYKWAHNKINVDLKIFKAHILSLYDKFKTDYKISVDYKVPFNDKEEEVQERIKDIASNISSYKSIHNGFNNSSSYNSHIVDASNIFLIEEKRENKHINIFDTKYFIISTDQYLRKWDYQRNLQTPIVILPSQWLSILLRYVKRTNDDYKSFVSFLNLPNTDTIIASDKLNAILVGISEITQNFEEQEKLVEILINESFKQILDDRGEQDEDKIIVKAKSFAKTELDKKIEEMSSERIELKTKIKEHSDKIEELKSLEGRISGTKDLECQNGRLRDIIIQKDLKHWQAMGWWSLIFAILIIIFIIFVVYSLFFCTDKNFVNIIVKGIDTKESDTVKEWLRNILFWMFTLLGGSFLFRLTSVFHNRVINKKRIEEKRQNLKKEYTSEKEDRMK